MATEEAKQAARVWGACVRVKDRLTNPAYAESVRVSFRQDPDRFDVVWLVSFDAKTEDPALVKAGKRRLHYGIVLPMLEMLHYSEEDLAGVFDRAADAWNAVGVGSCLS